MTERERLIEIMLNSRTPLISKPIAKTLADDLIKNGVIVPPCKVGDTVYEIAFPYRNGGREKVIKQRVVHSIEICNDRFITLRCGRTITLFASNIGETVFFTREEARKALEERDVNG